MPKNPFRIVLQNPEFLATLWRKPRLVGSVLRQRWLRWNRSRQGLNTLAGIEFALYCSDVDLPGSQVDGSHWHD